MSNLISRIYDDMRRYEALCVRFNEEVVMTEDAHGVMLPDPYGEHSKKLEKRAEAERVKNKAT